MKFRLVISLGLLCLVLAPAGAKADAQQDQSACMMDAQVYCGQFIPDRVRVAHCLMTNRRKITPACRAAIKHFRSTSLPRRSNVLS
ncbi:MAG: hypothetical protein WAM74_00500 [Xanthobacteraceae bacterium]